ncbi:MAG: alpha/beta hydrolase [Chloroflexota bacterium]|nr:alpha/beta hydrolase [Chloroflexota bacterium]
MDASREGNVMDGLFDVGGYRLYFRCEGADEPPVAMIAGGDDTHATWQGVRPEIATFARVCAYDRAGAYGGASDESPRPSSIGQMADDLRALLTAAGVAGPYVLVGHSSGGAAARLFADRYPDDVAGVVLLDPTPLNVMEQSSSWREEAAAVGFDPDRMIAEMRAATGFPDVPLKVLSHDPALGPAPGVSLSAEFEARWAQGQRQCATLSPRGEQITVAGAYHYIHESAPRVVVAAIRDVIRAIRDADARP